MKDIRLDRLTAAAECDIQTELDAVQRLSRSRTVPDVAAVIALEAQARDTVSATLLGAPRSHWYSVRVEALAGVVTAKSYGNKYSTTMLTFLYTNTSSHSSVFLRGVTRVELYPDKYAKRFNVYPSDETKIACLEYCARTLVLSDSKLLEYCKERVYSACMEVIA